jgi:hypothetical protein
MLCMTRHVKYSYLDFVHFSALTSICQKNKMSEIILSAAEAFEFPVGFEKLLVSRPWREPIGSRHLWGDI